MSEALKKVARYVEMRDTKPLMGVDEQSIITAIHLGTQWEAGFNLADLRAMVTDCRRMQQELETQHRTVTLENLFLRVKELFPEAVSVGVSEYIQDDEGGGKLYGWTAHAYSGPIIDRDRGTIAFGCGRSPDVVLIEMQADAKRRKGEA